MTRTRSQYRSGTFTSKSLLTVPCEQSLLWHLTGIPGYKCPVARTRHTRIQVSCGTYQAYQDASVLCTYQAYQDTSVLWHIFLVWNKSLKSPSRCTLPSAVGSRSGSLGYSFLLVLAICLRISSVSANFPFNNKYLEDSGVNLQYIKQLVHTYCCTYIELWMYAWSLEIT